LKCAVIIYHSNALKIYKREWIDKCVDSIMAQTYKSFDTIELNYTQDGSADFFTKGQLIKKPMTNHIQAMNYLIDFCLNLDYDVIFNVNLDDYYTPDRFEKQINAIINGADLVSSNFYYFSDERGVFKRMEMTKYANLQIQFRKRHNVIAHPVVAYSKRFFNTGLRYKDLIGYEDLDLWTRANYENKKITILADYLLHYRIHENQITKIHKGL
jgi:hypothetical protein